MKVKSVKIIQSKTKETVLDCFVGDGYLQGPGASFPDVDIDYQADRRQEVKEYIERRYNINGKQRVFSAGTMTTLKPKAVIKDVARTMRISPATVNYITAIFGNDCNTYTDIFKLAATNRKVSKFIHDYPRLFEDIRTLMYQPRSSSVHASALLVTPNDLDGQDAECFDFTPIKKVDGMLVSEFDGYTLDECGLLKNDCLGTKELSKLQATMAICNREYGTSLSLDELATGSLDDEKVYKLLSDGFTQNVFQFSSAGITKFLKDMKPANIEDLIAANALYRPATMDSLDEYVNRKSGIVAPSYLWGTYNALKNTYGLICYQEQVTFIAREVGNFSLGDGVKLVKNISKKRLEKIQAMKDKFMKGADTNGCPKEDAIEIWRQIEACGSYLFNRSHATAYAVTAYVGAWLKANYPTAFYTVALEYADGDEELTKIMGEMLSCSQAKVVPPDINKSGISFFTDYTTDSIFWSLTRVKMLGVKAAQWIIDERDKNGEFLDIENFIHRVFKYKLKKYQYWDDPDNEEEAQRCPVNARHVRHLILSGCFDQVERAESVVERYAIMEKAAHLLGFEITEKDVPSDLKDKHYFWSQQQIKLSGLGAIDYKRIYDNSAIKAQLKGKASYATFKDIEPSEAEEKRVVVCASIVEVNEKQFTSKKTNQVETFCKLVLQQNNDICECILWPEEYGPLRGQLLNAKDKLVIFNAMVKYSDYSSKNELQFMKRSLIEIL